MFKIVDKKALDKDTFMMNFMSLVLHHLLFPDSSLL